MTNEIIIILGKKGSGKSVMARQYVKEKRRLVVYDPMRQFGSCGVVITRRIDLLHYLRANGKGSFRCVYQPEIGLREDDFVKTEFKGICQAVSCLRNVYFMVDEIDNCLSPRQQDNSFFNNMIQRGRHDQISLVATTIRYTDVQRNLTAQADILICYHTHEPSDVQYFKAYFGDMAKELPALPPYHYIKYEKGQSSRHEPIKI